MSITVERVENEPVLIATIMGEVTEDAVLEVFTRSAKLMAGMGEKIFRITDVRQIQSTFSDMVMVLAQMRDSDVPGSTSDPRITTIFVGENEWVDMAVRAMEQSQYGGKMIPVFSDFDAAWEFIREHQ